MGHEYDLFIITPEPELTEFEEKVKELIGSYPHATNENKGSILYEVQKAAAELLELAKKEICKGCTVSIDSYIKGRDDEPHWKPSEEELLQLRCVISGCSYDIGPLVSLEKKLKQL